MFHFLGKTPSESDLLPILQKGLANILAHSSSTRTAGGISSGPVCEYWRQMVKDQNLENWKLKHWRKTS